MKLPLYFYQKLVNSKIVLNRYFFNPMLSQFNIKDKKVLDFGCGLGGCSPYFNSSNYLGVDIDEERINYAKKSYPNYCFSIIENEKIHLKNSSFDIIFVCGVLHHIPNRTVLKYLKEFNRLLKSDGKIIAFEAFIFPNSKLNNLAMKLLDEGKYIRSEQEYQTLFINEGFQVTIHKRIKTFYLYNLLFFSAEKTFLR